MFLFLLLAWPVAFIATYGMEHELGKEPLTGWRREAGRRASRGLEANLALVNCEMVNRHGEKTAGAMDAGQNLMTRVRTKE